MSLPRADAVAPLTRFVARVDGENALTFLHDTTTQDLLGVEPGNAVRTCYLDEKGRLLAELRVHVLDDTIWIDAEQAAHEAIMERLARIAPLSGVSFEQLDQRVTATPGFTGDAVTAPTGYGVDVIGPSVEGAPWDDFEVQRIAAGEPRFGVDVVEGTLINETPYATTALSFTKGCYPGQESVAKVHNLGSIRRHVVTVRFEGNAPAVPCALDDDAGTLTSASGGWGMATVRADADAGTVLHAGGMRLEVARGL